jgi:LemA protein
VVAILMSGTVVTIVVLAMIVILALSIALYVMSSYRNLVRLRNDLEKSLSAIDVLLKQRHDDLPKLIQNCKAYMSREQKPLDGIIEARTAYARATTPAEKAQADVLLTERLGALFAIAQKYPDLKNNANFTQLQKRLGTLDQSIAVQRAAYNDNVNAFNARISRMPAVLIARFMKLEPRPLFQPGSAVRESAGGRA